MKKILLTMVALLSMTTAVFAEGENNEAAEAAKYEINFNIVQKVFQNEIFI